MSQMLRLLKLDSKETHRLGKLTDRIKTVNEFLESVVQGTQKVGFVNAIGEALPWVGLAGESLVETVAPVKFLTKLFDKLQGLDDPEKLALLACTLAFEQSIEQAKGAIGILKFDPNQANAELFLNDDQRHDSPEYDWKLLSYATATQHAFFTDSLYLLQQALKALGLSEADNIKVACEVQRRFPIHLKTLVSHGNTQQRFSPFRVWLEQDVAGTHQPQQLLLQHADYQRWLFEEKPVFGHEPFTLAEVYEPLDCGVLRWGQIRSEKKRSGTYDSMLEVNKLARDPFDEDNGGRYPLHRTVWRYLRNPDFKDLLVIQGTAGAGKSAFTLALTHELIKMGLQPIRILLKDVQFDHTANLEEALSEAPRLTEKDYLAEGLVFPQKIDLFQNLQIFNEEITLNDGSKICPVVVILDGWDEISVAGSADLKQRIESLLNHVKNRILLPRTTPVRVILTGRPSVELAETGVLNANTPILTVRPFTAKQLKSFFDKVANSTNHSSRPADNSLAWPHFSIEALESVITEYAWALESKSKSLEVLGLPLLAQLALRLLVEPNTKHEDLLKNPTQLYRQLVDLTCPKAGKAKSTEETTENQKRYTGDELRQLLQQTAVTMNIRGQESVSYEELNLRLKPHFPDVQYEVKKQTDSSPLSKLMIAYYFKGGHRDLGCEFLHKSFREYLFAEAIVVCLKRFGRQTSNQLKKREGKERWQDFQESDPRYKLSRELGLLLGPQWLTPEVVKHLEQLLSFDIQNTAASSSGEVDLKIWKVIRDGVVDVWEWWVHQDPMKLKTDSNNLCEGKCTPLYYFELAAECLPLFLEKVDSAQKHESLLSLDSHLGDGLFRLCAWLHRFVAQAQGWNKSQSLSWFNEELAECKRSVFQTQVKSRSQSWVMFTPSGTQHDLFSHLISRINGTQERPRGQFPSWINIFGSSLFRSEIRGADLRGVDLIGANLRGANLIGADLREADLSSADLRGVGLIRADLRNANLHGADLRVADLNRADMSRTNLREADLIGADLIGANLCGANLSKAYLSRTNLRGADLTEANLRGAYLNGAKLENTVVTQTQLKSAILE